MKIQLLLTGNELMTGDTIDSNSSEIAQQLLPLGASVDRKVTVGDDLETLINNLQHQSQQADILIVNGGLGPTEDDLTALALARLTGQPLVEHPEALAHLTQWCNRRNVSINASNLKQTQLPKGAHIIANERGSAVGIQVQHNQCEIYATPGVPSELKAMLANCIIPDIAKYLPQQRTLRQRYQVFGLGESSIQQMVFDQFPNWPDEVELGFRSGAPTLEVKIQTPSTYQSLHDEWCQKIEALLADYIVGKGGESLASYLISELNASGKKITTAESCTGGLIASMLTQVSGSSAVFEAGFVTYANAIKEKVLNVSSDALANHGAVSEPVVQQMAKGALSISNADYVIAVSGIAGPDGGSQEKPVGTVWIAWGTAEDIHTECLSFPYHRQLFQTMVAGTGLDLIRRMNKKITSEPRYITARRLKR